MEKRQKVSASIQDLSQQLGKAPPQVVDLEEAVLGAVLLERDAIDTISFLNPEDFYKEQNQEIYKSVLSLFAENKPVDLFTVTNKLRELGKLDLCGGSYYITDITTRVNSSANIEAHARIIQEAALKRNLIVLSTDAQKDAYDATSDIFELLDRVDSGIMKMTERSGSEVVNIGTPDVLKKRLDHIVLAKQKRDRNEFIGTPSGLTALDRQTGGFKNTDLIIVAARPGAGKTAFAMSIALNNATWFKSPVGVFSLEMSRDQLHNRLISMESEVSTEKLSNGTLMDFELERVLNMTTSLADAPIIIDDTAGLSILQIRSRARIMKKRFGIKLLIVDYLQLIDGGRQRGDSREVEVSNIARGLKRLAKDLSIPVIALSQLSRAVEQRSDKRPQLSDLRESGSIEQEADMVLFLYRPEYYGINQSEDGTPLNGMGEIIVGKYRNGSTGSVWVRFISHLTKWADQEVYKREDSPY